ncbi:MAG: helix-turn-helix domain-containing protein [Lachnospiraceae bacterium]|nr:helix-turn-helix domain-containing protein [Lachnospiraceae bacterium]
MELGKEIRQLRKLSGMTQEQLAEKLNVSRQALSKWEKDLSTPDLESMVKISILFQVPLDELLMKEAKRMEERTTQITLEDLTKIQEHNRKMNVLLVSGSTYQDGDGNNASVFCEVWFGIDGNACDLGRIESMSTAYPIRYGDQCLYTASNQSFEIWMIDNENCELALKTQYQVVNGEDGSEAYYRIEDGVETVISEEEFWASYEIYESGTVARFAYGASDRS